MYTINGLRSIRWTLRDWQEFRRQTGKWPKLSILTYVISLAGWIAIVILFLRYADRHSWSSGQTKLMATAILLPTVVSFVLFWAVIERKVHVYEKRRWRARTALQRLKDQ
jgi:protein-S-isoprenylcysteine O-methyltransferase Ste14